MASSSGKSFIAALLVALTVSSMMSCSLAARRLLQTTQPSIPNMPGIPSNLPQPTGLPPLPSIPTNIPPLPTNLPNMPKPNALPPLPSMPQIPTVPQATLPPLPNIPSIPTIPITIPSIPFLSPPPSN
ncbi:proline-rich receptor-like protein kinase PERK2 [Neltuma alba]|uniref:proline-rich receptor-like protein kinase PERK2 n=1 Tax=Neltuma alba TaxID=207710 RepID=UPI0010A43C09|nr:proline-rich receptor-like protein kinase PERK2 [Prosopis alba]XP_028771699.1 proline-rich receptor-like protein kinase PERK2 [Prosopis alba]